MPIKDYNAGSFYVMDQYGNMTELSTIPELRPGAYVNDTDLATEMCGFEDLLADSEVSISVTFSHDSTRKLIRALVTNNCLKMHGIPMRRKVR